MALNFPNSPIVDEIYTPTGSIHRYRWDGIKWSILEIIDTAGDLIVHDGVRPAGISVGTSGQVLVARPGEGVAVQWETSSGATFQAGDRVVMGQNTAPAGWTLITEGAYNNAAIRLANSAGVADGGTTAFTSIFGTNRRTGETQLTLAQTPAHNHGVVGPFYLGTSFSSVEGGPAVSFPTLPERKTFSTQGGNGTHSHTTGLNLKHKTCVVCSYDG